MQREIQIMKVQFTMKMEQKRKERKKLKEGQTPDRHDRIRE
jgi:hypothetical protein